MKHYKNILGIITILFFIAVKANAQGAFSINKAHDFTKGGYSIFSGTMVDMPWTAVEESINKGAIVFLPIGVIEEHGPHMSCGSDIYQAYLSARIVKQELDKKGVPSLIAPPVYWGIADINNCFPGTFTVCETTFKSLLKDIFRSLKRWGVKNVVVFNGHGEPRHIETIKNTIVESQEVEDFHVYFMEENQQIANYQNTQFKDHIIPVKYKPEIEIDCRFDNCHADCVETGNMAGFFPSLVDTTMARTLEPTNFRNRKEFKTPRDVGDAWEKDARNITPDGYFGDPASFNSEKSVINYLNNSKSEAEAIANFFTSKGK